MDREGMGIIEKRDCKGFSTYLRRTENTICGRHPVGVLLSVRTVLCRTVSTVLYCSFCAVCVCLVWHGRAFSRELVKSIDCAGPDCQPLCVRLGSPTCFLRLFVYRPLLRGHVTVCRCSVLVFFFLFSMRQMLEHSQLDSAIQFVQYEQSSQCTSMRDSSVSYASGVVTISDGHHKKASTATRK